MGSFCAMCWGYTWVVLVCCVARFLGELRMSLLDNNRIADIRKEYTQAALDESMATAHPMDLFQRWLNEAIASDCPEPTAMALATVAANGQPSARMVLLKDLLNPTALEAMPGVLHANRGGWVFFSHYESRKGMELAANPKASLLFHWVLLERQVRLEGTVFKVSDAHSDAYYQSRPPGSRLGAWASPQSQVLQNRAELESLVSKAQQQLQAKAVDNTNQTTNEGMLNAVLDSSGAPLQRPPFWGGYVLVPHAVEFWQGRASRLHDRLAYTVSKDDTWTVCRLAP